MKESDVSKNIMHSGTSIVGLVCKDGIVMAGDRRSTAGGIIMSKKSQKIVPINDYLLVAGTGVASDIDFDQKLMAAELRLKQLRTKTRPTVKEAANLVGMSIYQSIRSPSMVAHIVGLLVGGYNQDGTFELYSIEPAGGVYKIEDYDANFSSGMPYILGLLEKMYKKDLTIKEGVEVARDCIKSGIERDSGSGNGVDVFVITKDAIKHVVSEQIIPQYK